MKKSPYPEDWTKSEAIITQEHVAYCHARNIAFWHTKVKGEPHMGRNGMFMKKAENDGFFDMLLLFENSVTFYLELKSGKGGVWAGHQIDQYNKVIQRDGYAMCSNSVKLTHQYLLSKGLVK